MEKPNETIERPDGSTFPVFTGWHASPAGRVIMREQRLKLAAEETPAVPGEVKPEADEQEAPQPKKSREKAQEN